MFRFKVGFIFFSVLPLLVTSKDPNACFKDFVLLRDADTLYLLLSIAVACNVMLLILNITIFSQVLILIKPTIFELRRQTFVIMDNILFSHIPQIVRGVLGCNKKTASEETKDEDTDTASNTPKRSKTPKKSKTSDE